MDPNHDNGAGAILHTRRITRSMSRSQPPPPPILPEHGADEEEDAAINEHGADEEEDAAINEHGDDDEEDAAINEHGADEEEDVAINEHGAEEHGAAINEHGADEEDAVINEHGAEEHGAGEEEAIWVQIIGGLHIIGVRLNNIRVAAGVRLNNFRVRLHNTGAAIKVRLYNFSVASLDRLIRAPLHNIGVIIEARLYNFSVASLDYLCNIFVAIWDRLYNFWVASWNRFGIWIRDTAFPAWRRVDWYLLHLVLLLLSILISGRVFSGVQQGYLKRHSHSPGIVSQQPFAGGNSFVDGLYWCTTTLTTVGFGDITPKTDGAKIATSFLIILGITGMAMVSQTFNDGWSEVEDCLSRKWGWNIGPRQWPGFQDFFWDNLRWWIGEWEMILRRILAAVYSVVLLFVGVGLFEHYENKFFVDAFYAAVVAESTVGYGDFFFTTKAARICACFWLFLSTSACCRMLGLQAEHRLQRRAGRLLRRELTTAELATINSNPNRVRAYYELQMLKSGKFVQRDLTWMRTHYIRISQPPGVQL